MAYGAVAGISTQKGSSPTHRSCIFITKDGELGQISVPLFIGIVGSNLSAPPNVSFDKKSHIQA